MITLKANIYFFNQLIHKYVYKKEISLVSLTINFIQP